MAAAHLAALCASRQAATEPCLTVLRQLEVIASLGPPVSTSPELLALVQRTVDQLQASPWLVVVAGGWWRWLVVG